MSKKKEIYRHTSPWTLYGLNWSVRSDRGLRLATGSLIEDASNKVRSAACGSCACIFDIIHSFIKFVDKATRPKKEKRKENVFIVSVVVGRRL